MSDAVFIYSTDTVWGIGGNIHVEGMAQKINSIKGYEKEVKPLSILFYDLNTLEDYFNLDFFDRDWLREFLKKEITLGLPVSWLKKTIPSEIYANSSFVCIRVLEFPHIKELISLAGAPVFTTSFNYRSEPPLLELDQAKQLRDRLCPEAQVLGSSVKLSGHSSTILYLDDDKKFNVLRPGSRVKEIEELIKLLTA